MLGSVALVEPRWFQIEYKAATGVGLEDLLIVDQETRHSTSLPMTLMAWRCSKLGSVHADQQKRYF